MLTPTTLCSVFNNLKLFAIFKAMKSEIRVTSEVDPLIIFCHALSLFHYECIILKYTEKMSWRVTFFVTVHIYKKHRKEGITRKQNYCDETALFSLLSCFNAPLGVLLLIDNAPSTAP